MDKVKRNTSKHELYYFLSQNSIKDLEQTLTDCFYLRDYRKGRGERDVGRIAFNWIADYHPVVFTHVLRYIPEYGRWDDLLHIKNKSLEPLIYKFLSNRLETDYLNIKLGLPISTCAKWMPSEGKSWARHHSLEFKHLLSVLKMNPKMYRTRLKLLRTYLKHCESKVKIGGSLLGGPFQSSESSDFYFKFIPKWVPYDVKTFQRKYQSEKKKRRKNPKKKKNPEDYKEILQYLNLTRPE